MELFIVTQKNPFIPLRQFVAKMDDGYEKVLVESPQGRLKVIGHEGLVYPHSALSPFLTKVQVQGLDRGSARQDRRRKEQAHNDDQKIMEEESVQELVDSVHERKLWPAQGGV